MKSYLSIFVTLPISLFLSSCLENNDQTLGSKKDGFFDQKENSDEASSFQSNGNANNATSDTIKYFDVKDSQTGMVMSSIPLPSTWKNQSQGDYTYIGPNGIKIYKERASMYMFNNDQQMNNMSEQSGMPIQFPKSVEQVINESFLPYNNKINRKLVKKYPIPQLASWDKQFDNQLYKSMPSQKTFTVMGLEWRDPDGKSFLTVLHHFVSYDNFGGYWGVIYTVLEAPENGFAKAKRQYINGLLNQKTNPQWIQASNQRDMQAAQQSNANHQANMANIKASGDRSTANHNARMAAMDQDMETWKSNQASDDRNHNRTIDNIRGNTNVTDPNTGKTYKVETGADQYWINDQGEYIKSDNSLYNPNQDQNINNKNWTEYEEQN